MSNWVVSCSYNSLDVDLTLTNVVTGQHEHYLNFNTRDPYGKGYCHQKLIEASAYGADFHLYDPFIRVEENLADVLSSGSPVNGVTSGAYSQLLIEYVDTDVNAETPESYMGIQP